jgi:hypothetical protein
MDYTFIILLVILLVLILLMANETKSIKEKMDEQQEKNKLLMDSMTKFIDQKIQIGVNNCTNKLKLINGEYLLQVRKMNELGSQVVHQDSNNFTDSESTMKNKKNKILYLSETFNDKNAKQEIDLNFKVDYDKQNTNTSQKNNNIEESKSENKTSSKSSQNKINEANKSIDSSDSSDSSDSTVHSDNTSIEIDPNILNDSEDDNEDEKSEKGSNNSINKKQYKDDASITTAEINLSLDNLKPINSYSKASLEKICKSYAIALTYKNEEKGSRRTFSKEDLYNKLKKKLEKK